MATYAELLEAAQNVDLKQRIRVAVIVAAEKVRTENPAPANHVERLAVAKAIFRNPDSFVGQFLQVVLAQNRAVTLASIISANDATVQTAVDAAFDVFI